MRNTLRPLLPALLVAWLVPASAGVTVSFVDAAKYTDVGDTARSAETVLRALERHLQALGNRYLQPGASLTLEVLDIDQAGRRKPFMHDPDVRVVYDGAHWPSIRRRFQLQIDDRVVDTGEEWLSDMVFMQRLTRYPVSEQLRYEKQMLDDWFARRVGPHGAAARGK